MDSWAPPFLESTGQLKSRIWEKDLLLYGDDMSSNLSEDCSLLGTVLSAFHGDFFFRSLLTNVVDAFIIPILLMK